MKKLIRLSLLLLPLLYASCLQKRNEAILENAVNGFDLNSYRSHHEEMVNAKAQELRNECIDTMLIYRLYYSDCSYIFYKGTAYNTVNMLKIGGVDLYKSYPANQNVFTFFNQNAKLIEEGLLNKPDIILLHYWTKKIEVIYGDSLVFKGTMMTPTTSIDYDNYFIRFLGVLDSELIWRESSSFQW